jgi:CBS domain-containing protein
MCGWRDEQQRRGAGERQCHEVLDFLADSEARKGTGQRRSEQEGEQDLDAGLHDPHLLQKLDEVPVAALELCLAASQTDRFWSRHVITMCHLRATPASGDESAAPCVRDSVCRRPPPVSTYITSIFHQPGGKTMAQSIDSVMTQNPVCLDVDASLIDAAQAMDKQCIGDVLVLEKGAVCGIVTDRDIAIRGVAHGGDPSTIRLGDICSRELVTLSPGAAIDDAIARMREHAVRRMPVLDGGRPVGIVSLGDLAEERDRRSVLGEISAAPANH